MKKIITCGLLLGLGWSVQAQTVLLTENFDYTAATNLQSNGWSSHSAAATNPIQVVSPGLSWSLTPYRANNVGNAAGVNNTGSDENRNFSSYPNSGNVYLSFLTKVQAPGANEVFLHLGQYTNTTTPVFTSINGAFRARTFVASANGAGANKFRLGLSFNSGTLANDTTAHLDTSKTYLVVVKYSFISGTLNDQVSLFLFEDGDNIALEPATPTIGPLTGSQADADFIQLVALRQFNANQRITVDGIVAQTSWDMLATNTWNGSAWSRGVAPNGENVVIDGNLTLTAALTAGTVTINSGNVLTLNAGANLNVQGNLVNNGRIDLGTNTLSIAGANSGTGTIRSNGGSVTITGNGDYGTLNFDQTTDGTTNVLANLTLNRNNTGTASLGNKLNLTGTLTLTAGTLTTNGQLHLKSSAANQTAQVIGGTNTNLSGNVTVERFLPWSSAGNNGFRFVGHPLRSAPVVNTVNNLPTATNTLIAYNESSNAYEGVNSRTGNWPQGTSYGVFTNATNTLSFTGELQLSAVNNLALTNANMRWNFVANPFPSTLDWNEVVKTDVQNAQWVWVKDNLVEGGGTWAAYVDGVATSGGNRYLAPMQGFMTRAAASGSPSLSFPTAARVTGQTPNYQRVSQQGELVRITLTKNNNNSSSETIIRFRQLASPQFEPAFDAEFMSDLVSATPDLFTSDVQGVRYSINSMEPLTGAPKSVGLQTVTFGAGSFTLNFNTAELTSGASIQLEDTKTGQITTISNGQGVNFTADANDAPNRFRLHFNGLSTSVENVYQSKLTAHVHQGTLFVSGINQPVTLQIFDLSGRQVFAAEKIEINAQGIQPSLVPGIYLVRLQGVNDVQYFKFKF